MWSWVMTVKEILSQITFAKAYVQMSHDMDCATVFKTVENMI